MTKETSANRLKNYIALIILLGAGVMMFNWDKPEKTVSESKVINMYAWMIDSLDPNKPFSKYVVEKLFYLDAKMYVGGELKARGVNNIFKYYLKARERKVSEDYNVKVMFTRGRHAVIQYRVVSTDESKHKSTRVTVLLLKFNKEDKIARWWELSRTLDSPEPSKT